MKRGREERAPALAAELVSLKPDLLVAISTANTRAFKQATSTIPIVTVGVINPVESGLVASLARPGGNFTGVADTASAEVAGKYLELLKELVPRVSHGAVLGYSRSPAEPFVGSQLQAAARALDGTLQVYRVEDLSEFEGAIAAMTKARAEAFLVRPSPFIRERASRIVDLAAQSRLPAVYPYREAVQAGGLMSFDANLADNFRRLGYYVDKIFKGAKPGRSPRRAADQVRLDRQPQDRQGARHRDSAIAAAARGRGDSVSRCMNDRPIMPVASSQLTFLRGMPDLKDLDCFSDKTIRHQIVPVDDEFSRVGVFTRAPHKGISTEIFDSLKNLVRE